VPRNQDGRDREVEELRRNFLAVRARLDAIRLQAEEVERDALEEAGAVGRPTEGSLFEPGLAAPAEAPPDAQPPPAPRRSRWARLLLVPVATLAAGLALGFAAGEARTGGASAAAPTTRPAAPPSSIVIRSTASSACLETARRGDQLIDLLITNKRGKAADLLLAYTVASRQCRRDASP
jgi:hypothetical protein